MKKYRLLYYLVLLLTVFIGCSKEDDGKQYYSVLGTFTKVGDSIIIVSDEDERLLVNNPSSTVKSIENNTRVIVDFTMSDLTKPAGIDYVIDIYDVTKVLFKPVVTINDRNSDSIGNDPMLVQQLWIIKDYLNLEFSFYGSTNVHYINLVNDSTDISSTDTINLELRHNDNDDNPAQLMNGFVTFDLSSLKSSEVDSVILHITANEYDNRIFNDYFVYKYQ